MSETPRSAGLGAEDDDSMPLVERLRASTGGWGAGGGETGAEGARDSEPAIRKSASLSTLPSSLAPASLSDALLPHGGGLTRSRSFGELCRSATATCVTPQPPDDNVGLDLDDDAAARDGSASLFTSPAAVRHRSAAASAFTPVSADRTAGTGEGATGTPEPTGPTGGHTLGYLPAFDTRRPPSLRPLGSRGPGAGPGASDSAVGAGHGAGAGAGSGAGAAALDPAHRFAGALHSEVSGVLSEAAVAFGEERDELLGDLYTNVTHRVDAVVNEMIKPATFTFYYEMLSEYYVAHPTTVAAVAGFWTVLWSHDLFPPVFALLFGPWLLSGGLRYASASQLQLGRTPSASGMFSPRAPSVADTPDSAASRGGRDRGGSGSEPLGPHSPGSPARLDGSPSTPRTPDTGGLRHRRRRSFATSTAETDSLAGGGVGERGSHYVALITGAARVFGLDVRRHTRTFGTLYGVMEAFVLRGLPEEAGAGGSFDESAETQLLRPLLIVRDAVFAYYCFYDEPENLRQLLLAVPPVDASILAGEHASTMPTDPDSILAFNAHEFVASATRNVSHIRNEASLVKVLNCFTGLEGVPLDFNSANRLHNMLHSFTAPGGPLFPTRPVRHAARHTVDVVFPGGRLVRRAIALAFRLLHPYYWPGSFVRWLGDCVAAASTLWRASVWHTLSSITTTACAPVRRVRRAITYVPRRLLAYAAAWIPWPFRSDVPPEDEVEGDMELEGPAVGVDGDSGFGAVSWRSGAGTGAGSVHSGATGSGSGSELDPEAEGGAGGSLPGSGSDDDGDSTVSEVEADADVHVAETASGSSSVGAARAPSRSDSDG